MGVIAVEHDPPVNVHDPPGLKVTIPVGVLGVPGDVSVTVAEHENWTPITPELGQLTVVAVLRAVVVRPNEAELPACVESASYVAVIVCVPWPVVGVYVTEQVAEAVLGFAKLHGEPTNKPVSLVVKLTVPVGGTAADDVSVTVAVQVVGWLIATDPRVQLIDVAVGLTATARLVKPELAECVESPP